MSRQIRAHPNFNRKIFICYNYSIQMYKTIRQFSYFTEDKINK